ncbi:hypothetical protein J2S59_001062 [Nocardioides massiliensis]|uniref:Uncharacterized protein n=1 Tax=Nocardioides massiliensis TaxID=1325935 RepID=A0ABT9NLH7_9ACTN|nr:hypothetical protein [Nocardioides massiliensis]
MPRVPLRRCSCTDRTHDTLQRLLHRVRSGLAVPTKGGER